MAAIVQCQRLEEIPADVLYIIFTFLDALSLIRLRQTCKHFSHLTYEHSVWADAYRFSHSFLPTLADTSSLSIPTLERRLVRALKLDWVWSEDGQDISPLYTRTLRLRDKSIRAYETFIFLFAGAYLLVATTSKLMLFDLDDDEDNVEDEWDEYPDPIHEVDVPNGKQGFFHFSEHEGVGYISLLPTLQTHNEPIPIWRVNDLQSTHPFIETLDPIPRPAYRSSVKSDLVGPYVFCAFREPEPTCWICHIPTRTVYTTESDSVSSGSLNYTWLACSPYHFIIADHLNIRVYPIPIPEDGQEQSHLHLRPTHIRRFLFYATEPYVYQSTPSSFHLAFISNVEPQKPQLDMVYVELSDSVLESPHPGNGDDEREELGMITLTHIQPKVSFGVPVFQLQVFTDRTGEMHRFVTVDLVRQNRMELLQSKPIGTVPDDAGDVRRRRHLHAHGQNLVHEQNLVSLVIEEPDDDSSADSHGGGGGRGGAGRFGDSAFCFDAMGGRMCVLRSDLTVLVQDYV